MQQKKLAGDPNENSNCHCCWIVLHYDLHRWWFEDEDDDDDDVVT